MRICIVQTKPIKGEIEQNLNVHLKFIKTAIEKNADIIIFPELSLTGYEPELARQLATTKNDERLNQFQNISDVQNIIICVGLPTKVKNDIFISMIIFQPNKERISYSKQYLYPTEEGIFTAEHNPLIINFDKNNIIAPAICYELSNPEHSKTAHKNNANIYIASVLNSVDGIDNDIKKLSEIAKRYKMTTFMSNYVGQSGGYECAGRSSVWNKNGDLIAQLDNKNEGLLVFDTESEEIIKKNINCH